MTPEYAAGFVDGEGSIGFMKSGQNRRHVPRVLVTNTDKEILETFREIWGGTIQKLSKREHNWKPAYYWRLTSRAAVNFLEEIYPHLILKRDQALLVFLWEEIRPGRGGRWTEDTLSAAELLNDQSKWLNARGILKPFAVEPMLEALY